MKVACVGEPASTFHIVRSLASRDLGASTGLLRYAQHCHRSPSPETGRRPILSSGGGPDLSFWGSIAELSGRRTRWPLARVGVSIHGGNGSRLTLLSAFFRAVVRTAISARDTVELGGI